MADVIVIGGGVTGTALAYYLAAFGRSVTVLEKHDIGFHGSGRSAGGVRQQGRVPEEIPLAMEAVRLWPTLADELGWPTEYVQGGNLLVAEDDAEMDMIEARIKRQKAFDLDSRVVEGAELRRLCPVLGPGARAALYCPTDGHANPLLTTIAFWKAAERRGVQVLTGTAARDVRYRPGGTWVVETDTGTHEAEVVVNAAGPGAAEICRWVGVHLPVVNCRVQTLVTERLPFMFTQFVQNWKTKTFARPNASGTILFGDLTEDYVFPDLRVLHGDGVRAAHGAIHAFPFLADVRIMRAWTGLLDVSIDQMPIIGEVPGNPGMFVVCGSSGHGFALGPIIGKLLAEQIVTGIESELVQPFTPLRFSSTGTIDNIDRA